MASKSFVVQGLVLGHEEPGEGHRDLNLFSAERGLLRCRRRLSSQKKHSAVPDLFSEIEIELNPLAGGHLYYFREWDIIRSRGGIGFDYRRLEAAGALARILVNNARWLETFEYAVQLLGKAFDALEAGSSPEAVRLKTLFLFIHSEGYPVEEDWRMALLESDRNAIIALMANSVDTCVADSSDLMRWRRSLEQWTVAKTDFIL